MSEYDKSPEQIEDEIRETQNRIDRRIDDLQASLSPSRLLDQFVPGLGTAGGETAQTIMRTVRENPIPAAVIGAGALWLMGSAANRQNGYSDHQRNVHGTTAHAHGEERDDYLDDDPLDDERTAAQRVGHNLNAARTRIAGRAAHAGRTAKAGAEDVSQRAKDLASDAADRTSDAARRARDAASALPEQMQAAGSQGVKWTKDNPIPAALMCVAAGAAIASIFTLRRSDNRDEANEVASTDHDTRSYRSESPAAARETEAGKTTSRKKPAAKRSSSKKTTAKKTTAKKSTTKKTTAAKSSRAKTSARKSAAAARTATTSAGSGTHATPTKSENKSDTSSAAR